jgi:hypothetical protein
MNYYYYICGISVYDFPDNCGIPDIPLHAYYKPFNNGSIQYFLNNNQTNKYRMIGDSVITCLYGGNWDKEPPIFEPIITCNTDQINKNSSLYKSIKFEKFEFFNRTQVAVIDSKILFQCNNEENSPKIHVSICNEKGLWIGDDLKCKLIAYIKKPII